MTLRLAAKGVFALGAATAALFAYPSFATNTPSTTPHPPPPQVAQQHFLPAWECGSACTRIHATQTSRTSTTPSPDLSSLVQPTDAPWVNLTSFLHNSPELYALEPTYDISQIILNVIETLISWTNVGRRLHTLAPTQLSTVAAISFGILTFIFPWITLPTKLDLLIPLWCVGMSIILAILSTPTFNAIQRRRLQFTKELQVQVEASYTELAERDESLAKCRSQLVEQEREANDAKKALDGAKEENTKTGITLSKCNEELSELGQKLITSADTATRLESEKAASENDAKSAREQRDSAQATFSTQLEQKDAAISGLETTGRNMSRRLENMEQEERSLAKQVRDKTTEMAALQRVNVYLREQIEGWKVRDEQTVSLLTGSEEMVEHLQAKLEAERTGARQIEGDLREKVESIKVLEGEKKSAVEELDEVKRAYALAETALGDLRGTVESAELVREERDALLSYKEQAEMEKAELRGEAENMGTQLATKDRMIAEAQEAQDARVEQLVTQQSERIQHLVEEHASTVRDLEGTHDAVVQDLKEKIIATNVTVDELHLRVLESERKDTVQLSLASPPITPSSARVINLPLPFEGSLPTDPSATFVEESAPSDGSTTTALSLPSESVATTEAPLPPFQGLGSWEELAQGGTTTAGLSVPVFTLGLPTSSHVPLDRSSAAKKSSQSSSSRASTDKRMSPLERRGWKRPTSETPRRFSATPRHQIPAAKDTSTAIAATKQVNSVASKQFFGVEASTVPNGSSAIPQRNDVLVVDPVERVVAPEQQVVEAPKAAVTPNTTPSTGFFQTPCVAWTEKGHLGVPISGVPTKSPLARSQPGGRGYRPMPRKLGGLSAHPLHATSTPRQPPSSPMPSDYTMAGPSQAPSFRTSLNPPLAISTPTSALRTAPIAPGLQTDFGGQRMAFQPSGASGSLSSSSRPVKSTRRLPTNSVPPTRTSEAAQPVGREALIAYWKQRVDAEVAAEGQKDEDESEGEDDDMEDQENQGGDGEDDDEEDDDDEETRRWRQRLRC